MAHETPYELKRGSLWINGERVGIDRRVIRPALEASGELPPAIGPGVLEGPVSRRAVDFILRYDRKVADLRLRATIHSSNMAIA